MKLFTAKDMTLAALVVASIATFGIGCDSTGSNPLASSDNSPQLGPIIDNRQPEYAFVYTGEVEKVDFAARTLSFLKTGDLVVVPGDAKIIAVPSKRLVPFSNKYIFPTAEITVKGYPKGDEYVAQVIEVPDAAVVGDDVFAKSGPIVSDKDHIGGYAFVFSGEVEKVDFAARTLSFLKTDYLVVVPQDVKVYSVPSRKLISFSDKHIFPAAEITVKGYPKGDEYVAEVIEVPDAASVAPTTIAGN